jgi:hypothetical protein
MRPQEAIYMPEMNVFPARLEHRVYQSFQILLGRNQLRSF